MKVEKLFKFVEHCLYDAEWITNRHDREVFFNQAFGAVRFFLESDEIGPGVEQIIVDAWEKEYRPQFEELIYG
jgi:hypothetical protein